MSDDYSLVDQYTIVVRVDLSKQSDNVAVDIGPLPPALVVDVLRQALEGVQATVGGSIATVFHRGQLVEPVWSRVSVDDDDE